MDMVSDSLTGRIAIIEMKPLSLREIMRDECKIAFLPTLEYIQERNNTVKKPDSIWEIIHRRVSGTSRFKYGLECVFVELYQNLFGKRCA